MTKYDNWEVTKDDDGDITTLKSTYQAKPKNNHTEKSKNTTAHFDFVLGMIDYQKMTGGSGLTYADDVKIVLTDEGRAVKIFKDVKTGKNVEIHSAVYWEPLAE